ncbi:hypothetical protein BGW80DRAFT_1277008, partial [Lactifluus volemus]
FRKGRIRTPRQFLQVLGAVPSPHLVASHRPPTTIMRYPLRQGRMRFCRI